VNLRWALERLAPLPREAVLEEARAIHREEVAANRALGEHGAALFSEAPVFYTHCNTGALATGGWGTALGVVRSAHARWRGRDAGRRLHVYVGET
ncbi:hypothetical protein JYB64_26600, partial [Algoriphagus aestuarii]|nr:hypothetical protein [Algoriphagus aestuarii]